MLLASVAIADIAHAEPPPYEGGSGYVNCYGGMLAQDCSHAEHPAHGTVEVRLSLTSAYPWVWEAYGAGSSGVIRRFDGWGAATAVGTVRITEASTEGSSRVALRITEYAYDTATGDYVYLGNVGGADIGPGTTTTITLGLPSRSDQAGRTRAILVDVYGFARIYPDYVGLPVPPGLPGCRFPLCPGAVVVPGVYRASVAAAAIVKDIAVTPQS